MYDIILYFTEISYIYIYIQCVREKTIPKFVFSNSVLIYISSQDNGDGTSSAAVSGPHNFSGS